MIVRIQSSLGSFKHIEFHSGLNILLSDTHPGATERQTRNSAGKTSLIEIMHFLLGADCNKDSLFRCPALIEHSFLGDFEIEDEKICVERTGSKPSRIYLLNGYNKRWHIIVKTEKESGRSYMSNENWKAFLGHAYFGLPEDIARINLW